MGLAAFDDSPAEKKPAARSQFAVVSVHMPFTHAQAKRASEEPAAPKPKDPFQAAGPAPGAPPAGLLGPRVPKNIDVLVCELCQGGHHEDQIILCDGCDKGFHMFCLSPPMEVVPPGEWLCPMCLGQQIVGEDAVVRPGVELTCAEFEKQAVAAKRLFWGGDVRARKVR